MAGESTYIALYVMGLQKRGWSGSWPGWSCVSNWGMLSSGPVPDSKQLQEAGQRSRYSANKSERR